MALLSQSLGTCPHPGVSEQGHSQEAQGSLAHHSLNNRRMKMKKHGHNKL